MPVFMIVRCHASVRHGTHGCVHDILLRACGMWRTCELMCAMNLVHVQACRSWLKLL